MNKFDAGLRMGGLQLGLAMLALVSIPAVGWAESNPRSVPADHRIRTVAFQDDNVVFLTGTMGVSTMIVFAPLANRRSSISAKPGRAPTGSAPETTES